MNYYLKRLKALGDETRIRILKVLLASDTELCVCEIVDALQIPFYTVSKHIKELKNADLLDESKNGKFVMYSIKKEDDPFISQLTEVIKLIPDDQFKNDKPFLQKRLALRENGKCVVGLLDVTGDITFTIKKKNGEV